MDNVINLKDLVQTLSELTGCTADEGEKFITALLGEVASRLTSASRVTVPKVGTFAVIDNAISFEPDRELADAVNAPFAGFEAVELPEGFDLPDEKIAAPPVAAPAPADEPDEPEEEPITEDEPEEEGVATEEVSEQADPEKPLPPVTLPEDPKADRTWLWLLIVAVVCFATGYLVGNQTASHSPETVTAPAAQPQSTDEPTTSGTAEPTAEPIVETPAPATRNTVVTDTVRHNNYLTTMARRHYGQMEYWVYIYQENASLLGDPDLVEAGTVVTVPPAEKYGLVRGDKAKINEATLLATEIYRKYKK